jgi:hypothetical protein
MTAIAASKGIDQVTAMLAQLHDGEGRLLAIDERAWASVTFNGHRYRATLSFKGQ